MDRFSAQLRIQARQLEQARQETLALRGALEALGRRCLPGGEMVALLREAERGVSPSQRPPKDEHKPSRMRGQVKEEAEPSQRALPSSPSRNTSPTGSVGE